MNQVEDVFKTIVGKVSDAIGFTVHFHHGHIVEIAGVLSEISRATQDSDVTWPVICLLHDFERGDNINGIGVKCTFVIATRTEPTYKAEERKELIFKPILSPIYEEFKRQIIDSKYVVDYPKGLDEWKNIWHYFYGSNDVMNGKNVFNEWTDSIEMNNIPLTISIPCGDIDLNTPRLLYSWVDVSGNYTYLKFNRLMKIPDDFVDCFLINSSNVETPFSCLDMYHGPTNDLIVFENASRINNEAVVTISTNSVLLLSVDEIAIQAFSGVKVVNYSEYV